MNKGRVYCSSDWHGCWHVAKKVLDYLQPEDTLYYLGDATDRGENGVKIFQALVNRPNTFYIKGNHDEMMANAIPYVWGEIEDINYYGGNGYSLWYQNGGNKTAKDFWKMTKEEVYAIKEAVNKMPTQLRYTSSAGHIIIMEHAGYSPFEFAYRRGHDPLWDRDHFYDEWNNGWEWQPGSEVDKTYLIHGHTPTMYLKYYYGYNGMPEKMTKEDLIAKRQFFEDIILDEEEIIKPEILRYCSGHKIDLDLCTIVSKRIALLDLDTFEVIYFDAD